MKKLKIFMFIFLVSVLILSMPALLTARKSEEPEPEPMPKEEKAAPMEEKAAPPPEQILIFGSSGDASRLDPGDVTDGESIQRMDNIFEGLVEYKPGSTEIQPALATSWEFSEDKKEITFNLNLQSRS